MTETWVKEHYAVLDLIKQYPYLRGELTDEWTLGVFILTKGGVTLADFEEAVDWWTKTPYEVHDDLRAIRTTALKVATKRMSAVIDHKRKKRVVKDGKDQVDKA